MSGRKEGQRIRDRKCNPSDSAAVSSKPDPSVVALDQALTGLSAGDPRKDQIAELRFFGGYNH